MWLLQKNLILILYKIKKILDNNMNRLDCRLVDVISVNHSNREKQIKSIIRELKKQQKKKLKLNAIVHKLRKLLEEHQKEQVREHQGFHHREHLKNNYMYIK